MSQSGVLENSRHGLGELTLMAQIDPRHLVRPAVTKCQSYVCCCKPRLIPPLDDGKLVVVKFQFVHGIAFHVMPIGRKKTASRAVRVNWCKSIAKLGVKRGEVLNLDVVAHVFVAHLVCAQRDVPCVVTVTNHHPASLVAVMMVNR